jgi:high-affinity nickel permease
MTHEAVANISNVTSLFLDTIGTAESGFFLTLILFTGVIVLYSLLIFYFYKFLAKKNIIELNLGSHNQYETGMF